MNLNRRPYLRPIILSDINNPPIGYYIPKTSYKTNIRKQIDYIRDYIKLCEEQLEYQDFSYFNWSFYKVEYLKAIRSLKIYYKQASILAA